MVSVSCTALFLFRHLFASILLWYEKGKGGARMESGNDQGVGWKYVVAKQEACGYGTGG